MFFEPFWKGNLIQLTVLQQFLGPHWGLKSVLCSRQPVWGVGHVGLRLLHWLFDAKTCASGWPKEKQVWSCKFRLPVWWMIVLLPESIAPEYVPIESRFWTNIIMGTPQSPRSSGFATPMKYTHVASSSWPLSILAKLPTNKKPHKWPLCFCVFQREFC